MATSRTSSDNDSGAWVMVDAENNLQETPFSEEISKIVVLVRLHTAAAALGSDQSISRALSDLGAIPTEEEARNRQAAFETLQDIVTDKHTENDTDEANRRPKHSLVMVPVGSYGLGIWNSSSSIDCLCIGPYSSNTFFALVTQRIRRASASTQRRISLLRRVCATNGTVLELEVQGIKINLQYCGATAVAEQWPESLKLPVDDPIFALPTPTLTKLKAVRDMDYLRRTIPDMAQFRLAHRAIKTWAESRGIYSTRFGYLGSFQISVLLVRVCKLLARDHGSSNSVADILTSFFVHYATFDWGTQIAFDPFFHSKKLPYRRTSLHPISILGFHTPELNTAQAVTGCAAKIIQKEFRRASEILTQDGMTWPIFLSGGPSNTTAGHSRSLPRGAADFIVPTSSFAKIDFQYWGISPGKGSRFVGWLESRCPMLLTDMARRLPRVHTRMWPQRFVDAASSVSSTSPGGGRQDEREYQGCYLVKLGEDGTATKGSAAVAVQTVLRSFEELIRGDEKHFDGKSQWFSASVVHGSDIGPLAVDTRPWGDYTAGEDEEDDPEEECSEDDNDMAEKYPFKKNKRGKRSIKNEEILAQVPKTSGKLRTAADVMNRLRWDASIDSGDYAVGYEDRFKGAMEKELEAWKWEQTDEEFIPQHRILYFKRKGDGAIVWERHTRKDEVFGSG